ncbi:unnamed protein product [Malus baccata var. baccata]
MGEVIEIIPEHRSLSSAPNVFIIVVAVARAGGVKSATATRLRGEIKDILKEASSLSQPSTFAQAAKLRRIAASKEKELAYSRPHLVLTYVVLVCWFWRVPVASISQQLAQPFGNAFLYRIYCPSPLFFLEDDIMEGWRSRNNSLVDIIYQGQQVHMSTCQVLELFIKIQQNSVMLFVFGNQMPMRSPTTMPMMELRVDPRENQEI